MLLGELWKLDASVKPSTLMVMLSYLTMNLQVSLGQENRKAFNRLYCHELSVSPLCKSHCPHFTSKNPRSELHRLVESIQLSWYLDHTFQSLIASITLSTHALNYWYYSLVLALILQFSFLLSDF